MKIIVGTQTIENDTKRAIAEFHFEKYEIYVFQGALSQFDIIIKYRHEGSRIRTPKHIHWVVDVLMKMQADELLTRDFLNEMKICWKRTIPLKNNDFETLKGLVENGEKLLDINKYSKLNAYGEYDVEFLYVLMQLLAAQEKTNRSDAYMFGKIIDELLEKERDIFKIVSTAGFGGR